VLNRDQIELIHREIDDANTPEESVACGSLMEENAEARELAAELRRVARLFDRVGEREPPSHLKRAILDSLPLPAMSRTESGLMTPRAVLRWSVQQLTLGAERLEEAIMTKKTMLIGGTAVAIVIVIAGLVAGFPPRGGEAGTIGGVEKASRYQGRAMTEADVTIENPEIAALFQNDQILQLVRSDVFREVMGSDAFRQALADDAFRQALANDAFREAITNDAFREAVASDAFREALASDAFREAVASDAFREAVASDAFREAIASDAFREAIASDAFREAIASDAFREALASDAFREALASDAFREALASDAFREALTSDAFREAIATDAFREALANDAFRELLGSDVFQSLAQSQELSRSFVDEAQRVER